MQNKTIRALFCSALLCLLLAGCGKSADAALAPSMPPASTDIVFAAGSVSPDATEIKMQLRAGETALLDSLPALSSADLSGSEDEREVAAWCKAHPEVECYYTVTLPGGEVLDSGTKSYDLSGASLDDAMAAAEKLALLPALRTLRLGSEGGSQTWESLASLRTLLPDTVFRYGFTLYGKSCDLSDASLNLRGVPIGDGGAELRRVIPLMRDLNYVDMDSTGVSNGEMEKLRADYPDVKFVWRVFFGDSYSVRTDVQRILASKPSAGGMIYDWDVEALSCCHEVVFLDLGHNQGLTDISFVSQMPKLEVAILGMCGWSDATPLASCPELEYLEMFSTNCTDLSPLAKCKNLKHLNAANIVGLEDISPMYTMTQLERFYIGSMNRVPWEQCEEFQKRVPNCEFDTLVYEDPTGGHWRWDENADQVPRYYLLRMQFGNYESEVYSFTWNDKLYNP
ncbi:MAG: hypothetical protein IJT29_03070 [Oscillospiraceae bacterium]|nr:hypothetical protein [Oscillospiraceae bacterium]